MEAKARHVAHAAGERSLSRKISRLEPEVIVSLARSIHANVGKAAAAANWQGVIIDVPYPGRWVRHNRLFMAMLLQLIKGTLQVSHVRERSAV
jgi:hypothetical protein